MIYTCQAALESVIAHTSQYGKERFEVYMVLSAIQMALGRGGGAVLQLEIICTLL